MNFHLQWILNFVNLNGTENLSNKNERNLFCYTLSCYISFLKSKCNIIECNRIKNYFISFSCKMIVNLSTFIKSEENVHHLSRLKWISSPLLANRMHLCALSDSITKKAIVNPWKVMNPFFMQVLRFCIKYLHEKMVDKNSSVSCLSFLLIPSLC